MTTADQSLNASKTMFSCQFMLISLETPPAQSTSTTVNHTSTRKDKRDIVRLNTLLKMISSLPQIRKELSTMGLKGSLKLLYMDLKMSHQSFMTRSWDKILSSFLTREPRQSTLRAILHLKSSKFKSVIEQVSYSNSHFVKTFHLTINIYQ